MASFEVKIIHMSNLKIQLKKNTEISKNLKSDKI